MEYDKLSRPSRVVKNRIEYMRERLIKSGYVLVLRDGLNFTYVLEGIRDNN